MKTFVITLKDDPLSEAAAKKTIESCREINQDSLDIENYDAVTPDRVDELMKRYKLRWVYPWIGRTLDLKSGLMLSAYETSQPKKRIACFLSHYELWKKCIELNEPIIVLEHDALFINKVDLDLLYNSKYYIISLNDPRGATRKSQLYYDTVKNTCLPIASVPKIDDDQIPQGLPGNSAYYLKPEGAKRLVYLTNEYGAWPNDAIMCKQLIPNRLGVLTNFSTRVQGIKSTTTL